MQKCPICHEDFEPEDAYDHFYRHLLEVGHPEDEDMYDEDLCGSCNRDKWYEKLEAYHADHPDEYDKFIDFWNMVND